MRIVICGNYGAGNIGDELILEGILDLINNVFKNAQITVLSADPKETARRHNVKSLDKIPAGCRSVFNVIIKGKCEAYRAIKECDFFVMGGGGLFGGVEKRANFIWGMQALIPIILKKPIIMVGQSVGKIGNGFIKFIIKTTFKRAKIISVRDVESKKRLKKLGINGKIYITPDNAFRLSITPKEKNKKREKKIIIALRQMNGINNEFVKNIANFIKFLMINGGWKIKILNFQNGENGDKKIHGRVIRECADTSKIEYVGEINSKEELFKHFAEAEFCLGMRLHSVITSILTNTPFIAINYAPKVAGVINLAKMNDYMLDMKKSNSHELNKKFQKIMKEKEKIKKILNDYCEKAHGRHLEAEKKMLLSFNSNPHKFYQPSSH